MRVHPRHEVLHPAAFSQIRERQRALGVRYGVTCAYVVVRCSGLGARRTARRVTRSLLHRLRSTDFIANPDPTTVAVLMPETDTTQARTVVERACAALAGGRARRGVSCLAEELVDGLHRRTGTGGVGVPLTEGSGHD